MDEYISREELLKHLNECRNDPLFDPDMARICFAISIFVENMKSADVQPVNQWISCKDKMPEDRTLVLFCYVNEKGLKSVHYGYHFNINGITAWAKPSGGYCDEEITHWQPLPEPPKDGDTNG